MTCGPVPTTFRVLDAAGGWSQDLSSAPAGILVGEVIELADALRCRSSEARALDPAIVDRHLLPPRLTRGCRPCDLYLATSDPRCRPGVWLQVGARWRAIAGGHGCSLGVVAPVAVSVAGDRLAIRDADRGQVLVMPSAGGRIVQAASVPGRGPIALSREGIIWAVSEDPRIVVGFDRAGEQIATLPPADAPIERLAVDHDGQVWIAIPADVPPSVPPAGYVVARLVGEGQDASWQPATADGLGRALPDTGLVAHDPAVGFSITQPRGSAGVEPSSFDWCGRPLADPLPPSRPTPRRTEGVVAFPAIDSGLPRCRWHRVRLDADVPLGTRVEIAVATLEERVTSVAEADQRIGAGPWSPGGLDWQVTDALDFLIDRAPGRYLHLRLRLHSRGDASPTIRRIRIDFPRSTSAEHLPGVYREPDASPAFLEHFVSLFDATLEDLDRAIERFPALLDAGRAPTDALPWLASLLDLSLEPAWDAERRRALIAALPTLYRLRGTPEGLRLAIELTCAVSPAIEELGATSPFADLGRARLGDVRLFGRARARARLGASRLGSTRLDSYGDPDDDVGRALAHRIRIKVPRTAGLDTEAGRERLERVVRSQTPAHVVASVVVGRSFPLVGLGSVGIDTLLTTVPPPILGRAGNARLRRMTVLWPGRRRAGAVLSVDRSAAVGVHTILR